MKWDLIEAHYHASATPLLRLPPAAFAGRIHAWAYERVPGDRLEEWEQEMSDLLPWQDSTSSSAEELESESFFANYNGQQ